MIFENPDRELARQRLHFWWLYLAQGVALGVGTVVLKMIWMSLLGSSEMSLSPLASAGWQLAYAGVLLTAAFSTGTLLQRLAPHLTASAVWLWVPPVVLLSVAIMIDLMTFHFDWGLIWRQYFFWAHPGRDVGPFLRDLLTYPAISCSGYALGASRVSVPTISENHSLRLE